MKLHTNEIEALYPNVNWKKGDWLNGDSPTNKSSSRIRGTSTTRDDVLLAFFVNSHKPIEIGSIKYRTINEDHSRLDDSTPSITGIKKHDI